MSKEDTVDEGVQPGSPVGVGGDGLLELGPPELILANSGQLVRKGAHPATADGWCHGTDDLHRIWHHFFGRGWRASWEIKPERVPSISLDVCDTFCMVLKES